MCMYCGDVSDASKHKKRVPKGTSEYQASWIIDDEDNVRLYTVVHCLCTYTTSGH